MQPTDSLFLVDTVTGPNYIVFASTEGAAKRLVEDLGVQVHKVQALEGSNGTPGDGTLSIWKLP
jgi:hypothetical protein